MSNSYRYRNPLASTGGAVVLLWFIHILFPGCGKTGQNGAVHEITEAGGRIQVDERDPEKPVIRVDLDGFKRTGFLTFGPLCDEGLEHLRPSLESLPRLRYLRISSMARLSDAGLVHLEGLRQLETIELYGGGITESGVNRLRKNLPKATISHSPGYDP